MFVGNGFFGVDSPSENYLASNNIYRAEISNGIYDEFHIKSDIISPYNTVKESWQYSTLLLAKFQNSLAGGNVDNEGVPIVAVQIKRRATTDFEWQNVVKLPYSNSITGYEWTDRFVPSNVEQEYAFVPLSSGDIEGNYTTAKITPKFEGVFLCDKDTNIQLLYDLEYGDIQRNVPSARFEPLGGKYPITIFGTMDFKSGSITATVLSAQTRSGESTDFNHFNLQYERKVMDNIQDFLNNRKIKVLKDGNGRYMAVNTTNTNEKPFNEFQGAINKVGFEWNEAYANDNASLQNIGVMKTTST